MPNPPHRTARTRLGRGGFTLTEALVALALVGVVAGVVITRMVSPQEDSETGALAQNLSALSAGIQAYRGDVGRYPARLGDLSSPPEGSARDLCGRSVPLEQLEAWRGPYLSREVGPTGVISGDGVIASALRRDPPSRADGAFGHLLIDVANVESATATSLDELLDGGDGFSSGTVRWSPSGGSTQGDLTYRIPVRGC